MKPRYITYEFKCEKAPEWALRAVAKKAEKNRKFIEQCKNLQIEWDTK